MIPKINFDTIFSDPLLLIAAVLLVLGPIVFLIAVVQFVRAGKRKDTLELPAEEPMISVEEEKLPDAPIAPSYVQEVKEEEPPQQPAIQQRTGMPHDPDKTVVIPSGMGEVQGQLEIAFTQIKTLNKKIAQLESEVERLSRNASSKLDANELKEVPMNPADFTQKLLKLAEHVIVLEKEMARMKATARAAVAEQPHAAEPTASKPPIMPI